MTINNFINTKKSNITRYNKQHTNSKTTLLSSPIMTRKNMLLGLVLICIVLQLSTDFLSSLKQQQQQQQQQPQQYENKNNVNKNNNDNNYNHNYYDEKVAEINDPLKDIMPSLIYRRSNNIPNWMKGTCSTGENEMKERVEVLITSHKQSHACSQLVSLESSRNRVKSSQELY